MSIITDKHSYGGPSGQGTQTRVHFLDWCDVCNARIPWNRIFRPASAFKVAEYADPRFVRCACCARDFWVRERAA